jgi:putative transposase
MPKGVSQLGKGIVEQELTNMFEPKWIRATAKESGLIERERKIDPVIMFWTLAIGYGSQLYRTLTELKREYEVRGNVSISDSSWHDRFTPELVKFLKQCVLHGIEHISQEPSRILGDRLATFRDVMIQDSTIIRLHESLADNWPATRSKRVAAGVKVSFLTSAVANGPKSISILPENTSEMKTLKIGPWIKNIILLIDLGFYKYQLFSRIVENGGSFVSRLKSNSNPLIVGINQVRNCRGIDLVTSGPKVHNPGGLKVHTSTSLASNLKGCGDVAGRRVPHVKRSLQTGIEHQRDRPSNGLQSQDSKQIRER